MLASTKYCFRFLTSKSLRASLASALDKLAVVITITCTRNRNRSNSVFINTERLEVGVLELVEYVATIAQALLKCSVCLAS